MYGGCVLSDHGLLSNYDGPNTKVITMQLFSIFELGGITKHLMTVSAGTLLLAILT